LAGQTVTRDKGDVTLTPFYAPTGQMTLRGSVFEQPRDAASAIGGPADALTGWRRSDFDGANFDIRAVRDGAVTTHGKPENRGAPSPTWLATMAIRLFPLCERGGESSAPSWHRVSLYSGATRRSLVWPVWSPMLDAAAVRALLSHPATAVHQRSDASNTVVPTSPEQLAELGVTGLYGSSRLTRSQGDGPLGATIRVWQAAE
jgi:hypothetical protein